MQKNQQKTRMPNGHLKLKASLCFISWIRQRCIYCTCSRAAGSSLFLLNEAESPAIVPCHTWSWKQSWFVASGYWSSWTRHQWLPARPFLRRKKASALNPFCRIASDPTKSVYTWHSLHPTPSGTSSKTAHIIRALQMPHVPCICCIRCAEMLSRSTGIFREHQVVV